MPSSARKKKKIKPGDVITQLNGKTVEVNNTDAEGRLILADALTYCVRLLGAERLVDLATFFFLMIRPPPTSTLFPYTTLFRPQPAHAAHHPPEPGLLPRRDRHPRRRHLDPWHPPPPRRRRPRGQHDHRRAQWPALTEDQRRHGGKIVRRLVTRHCTIPDDHFRTLVGADERPQVGGHALVNGHIVSPSRLSHEQVRPGRAIEHPRKKWFR